VRLPTVERHLSAENFRLSAVPNEVFAEIGRKVADAHGARLDRKLLDVVDDGAGGFTLVPRAGESLDATQVALPFGQVKDMLVDTVMALSFLPDDRETRNGAVRLVDAAIQAAGGEEKLAAYHDIVADMVKKTLRKRFQAGPAREQNTISLAPFKPVRTTTRPQETNRFAPFSRDTAYGSWSRSTHPWNWFDSEPERALANLLDDAPPAAGVGVWARILRGEFDISWAVGRYVPDFYAEVGSVHYLLEVKADKDMATPDVQAKKTAAVQLANAVTDTGSAGQWRYVLISESDLRGFRDVGDLLRAATI
jgi:hypothetical protein